MKPLDTPIITSCDSISKKVSRKDDQLTSVRSEQCKIQQHSKQQIKERKSSYEREISCNANSVIILGDSMVKHQTDGKCQRKYVTQTTKFMQNNFRDQI